MTNEDKKIVADYMKWIFSEYGGEYYYIPKNGKVIYFDLNDAELVVNELARNGEWREFYESCFPLFVATNPLTISPGFLNLWLFNADNFFKVFVEWRKRNEQS